MLKCWNITPFMFFNHMINKVNSQKNNIFLHKKMSRSQTLNEWVFVPFWNICTFFSCRIRAPDIFEIHPCCRCTFLPGAQWHMAFPHSAQWHIRRKTGKKLHSLAHSCSNYISRCQFFSQPRWVFGKKVKFLEKELFMLKGTSCDTLKSVPIQLISRRN